MTPAEPGAPTAPRTIARPWLAPPWKPGQSGNPQGYQNLAKRLAKEIRDECGDGRELIAFFFAVLRGEAFSRRRGDRRRILRVYPTIMERMTAAMWLADRGWGKAKELVEIIDEHTPEERRALVRVMTDEERAILRKLLEAAEARLPRTSSPVTIDAASPSVIQPPRSEMPDGPAVASAPPSPDAAESPPTT
jgi:hypothetical protein